MFYDVRVIDPQGNVKQTISGRELAREHWSKFRKAEEQNNFIRLERERVLQELKKIQACGFPAADEMSGSKGMQKS